jgi:uncharacterized surface anchored protein
MPIPQEFLEKSNGQIDYFFLTFDYGLTMKSDDYELGKIKEQ